MSGSIGVGSMSATAGSGEELMEENRRLRAELDALRKVHGTVSESPLRQMQKFYDDECLRSSDFNTPRGQAAKDAINDDVTHEFFSAHERNTALNVQRDIRQSCRIAEDRRRKLRDARQILERAAASVDESATNTQESLDDVFEGFFDELRAREDQFRDDLDRHRRGELVKIQKEQRIVKQLLETLQTLVVEAQDVMTGPREKGDEAPVEEGDYKTLAEIKDEFTELRQIMLPWDLGYLFDKITAKASEQMIDIRTTAVHDIISGLILTLNSAREKADATYDTLTQFMKEVDRVVPETAQRVHEEFDNFRDVTKSKYRTFSEKIHRYRQNYSQRIQTEIDYVDEWSTKLTGQQQDAQEAVASGNDHNLLKKLEALNGALVQVDGTTLTLGYDKISFVTGGSALSNALDQLGALQREALDCKPLFGNCFHYYHFLEHKEYIYGTSEDGAAPEAQSSTTNIGQRERDMFESAFRRIDTDQSGTLDETELEVLWGQVFTTVPRASVRAITARIFKEIDQNGNGIINFEEFLDYITSGMKTNLAAQRELFYRDRIAGGDTKSPSANAKG
eukprot:Hpha_TRINITY_DN12217_c0_g2::TRINITY_DN12217_c0_g2_i1::g.16923::m.16923